MIYLNMKYAYSWNTPLSQTLYPSGGEPMARVSEVALRALSVGTQAITPGQSSPNRTKHIKSSRCCS
ncbi:hypothetical protein GDO81_002388 [Engystomops pustulosus]|uniref:Uncharacterized protein n=1 Tax=Engystomops pustulosus TaxID=76066 RepID=A0AAV7DJW0_ENGPU|nr:hypothetical protein GDO81_002388 [Engystomops pustulosus]